MEVLPNELNLFDTRPLMMAVTGSEILETSPLNSLDGNNSIDYTILGYLDKFKDLQSIHLKLKLRVLKKDGKPYTVADTDQPYLIPNIGSSIFKSCFISIQSTPINGFENSYNYKDFLECSLSYNKTTLSTRFSAQMYNGDETEATLKKAIANSATFEIFTKVNVGSVTKLLLPGVSLSLRFVLENPDFFFMEDTTKSDSILKILDARLFCRHISVDNSFMLSVEKKLLSNNNICYQYRRPVIITNNVPAQISSINLPAMWTGMKPSLALFFMVKHSAVSGSRKLMPYKFENFNISSFSYVVDGALLPPNSYKISVDDADKSYSQIFARLHESLGYGNADRSCVISSDNYKNSFFIVGEDLTRFGTANTEVLDPLSQVTLGVQASFSKALESPITVFLYLLIDTEFQIDKNRAVTLVY